MIQHKYNKGHWNAYYEDTIDEDTRLDMTLHLSECDECLGYYTECIEANISPAPLELKKDIMAKINQPYNTKQVMLAYIAAASIALGFYSSGLINKTVDYTPRRVEQSIKVANTVADNASQMINNFVWRD